MKDNMAEGWTNCEDELQETKGRLAACRSKCEILARQRDELLAACEEVLPITKGALPRQQLKDAIARAKGESDVR